jgi:cobalt transporter subunit CbtB
MTIQIITSQSSQVKTVASVTVQNIAALAFGAIVIFAVGFLPMDVAHNAAHDTRHAMAFPCH